MKHAICTLLLLAAALTAGAQPSATHPWQGRRVAYLGDSITDPNVRPEGTAKWWEKLSEWLSIEAFCYARSGREWIDIPRQVGLLQKEHAQDVDAIVILMGTNDFNHSIPLGQWYDVQTDTVTYGRGKTPLTLSQPHRQLAYCDTTFRGRINIAMRLLRTEYPTKQVVLLTPIHRALFTRGMQNHQPDESWPNTIGLYHDQYAEAVLEASRVWSVPVIDLNGLTGLMPLLPEHGQFFTNPDTDRLHPNDAGYQRMALTIYWQLSQLPCVF